METFLGIFFSSHEERLIIVHGLEYSKLNIIELLIEEKFTAINNPITITRLENLLKCFLIAK